MQSFGKSWSLVLISIFLYWCFRIGQFQASVAYKSVAYKRKSVYTVFSRIIHFARIISQSGDRAAKYVLFPRTTTRINRKFPPRNRPFFLSNHFASLYRRYELYRPFAALSVDHFCYILQIREDDVIDI